MKKVSKKIGMMLLVIVMIMVGLPLDTTEVAAKATNQKAIKAYTKMLSKKYYKWEKYSGSAYKEYDVNKTKNYDFFCIDLNKDGVKELLVWNNIASYAEGYVKIFTYKNGKVKCLLTSSGIEVYKKSMTIACEFRRTGFCWGYFYKMKKNGKLVKKVSYEGSDYDTGKKIKHMDTKQGIYYTSCKVGKKNVSYATYKKKLSSLLKNSKKKVNIKWHKNTAGNRKKYLK